ncbi:MAG: hypothetical protein LBH13_08505 [Cellulomonadaceae bacterium]|jgi:hypothetical protein|nr:hypothetical protein [Cellulomonadaceae bacterium]
MLRKDYIRDYLSVSANLDNAIPHPVFELNGYQVIDITVASHDISTSRVETNGITLAILTVDSRFQIAKFLEGLTDSEIVDEVTELFEILKQIIAGKFVYVHSFIPCLQVEMTNGETIEIEEKITPKLLIQALGNKVRNALRMH